MTIRRRVERLERHVNEQAGRVWMANIRKHPGMTDEDVEREIERIRAEWRSEGWQDGDRALFIIVERSPSQPTGGSGIPPFCNSDH